MSQEQTIISQNTLTAISMAKAYFKNNPSTIKFVQRFEYFIFHLFKGKLYMTMLTDAISAIKEGL